MLYRSTQRPHRLPSTAISFDNASRRGCFGRGRQLLRRRLVDVRDGRRSAAVRGRRARVNEGPTLPRLTTFVVCVFSLPTSTLTTSPHPACQPAISYHQTAASRRCYEHPNSPRRPPRPPADQGRSARQPRDSQRLCSRGASQVCQCCQGVSGSLLARLLIPC
jgi:hypothetical protein